MRRKLRFAITTGDSDGIGLEVTAKALQKSGPISGVQFLILRSEGCSSKHLGWIDKVFDRHVCRSLEEANSIRAIKDNVIIDIARNDSPAHWVKSSAEMALAGKLDGLVTAPLSKTEIAKAGYSEIGHTEIFKTVCQVENLFMGFVGAKFAVVLTTGHIPLSEIRNRLTPEVLSASIKAAAQLRNLLEKPRLARPIGLVGLNPHAGENGLIGHEEVNFFAKVIRNHGLKGVRVEGPLVPDAAFLPMNWPKYSVFVCPYHDQGLIPFKIVHGQEHGVHITLGLPFVRTSVDHGTAKGIYGLDKANASSMLRALKMAVVLGKAKK